VSRRFCSVAGRRSTRAAVLLSLALVASCAAACGPAEATHLRMPECNSDNATMVLMAQAVPTASLLPCIRSLPTGWSFSSFDVHNGLASFWLDNDRAGPRALGVSLQAGCALRGTPTPSDKPGSQLYVKIDSLSPRFTGTRYYRFPRECVTYDFSFPTEDRAFFVTDVTDAIGFMTRAQVRRFVSGYGFTL